MVTPSLPKKMPKKPSIGRQRRCVPATSAQGECPAKVRKVPTSRRPYPGGRPQVNSPDFSFVEVAGFVWRSLPETTTHRAAMLLHLAKGRLHFAEAVVSGLGGKALHDHALKSCFCSLIRNCASRICFSAEMSWTRNIDVGLLSPRTSLAHYISSRTEFLNPQTNGVFMNFGGECTKVLCSHSGACRAGQ
jgi:hypothetical protein